MVSIRKTILILLTVWFCTASMAQAKGVQGVGYTVHNLAVKLPDGTASTSQYRTNEQQICIFCHTPHGGTLDGPLWNRELPSASLGWTFYDSTTLSVEAKGVTEVSVESLLCLSCHDGSLATNRVINPSSSGQPVSWTGGDAVITGNIPYTYTRIGGKVKSSVPFGVDNSTGYIADDHPISFDYQAVINEAGDDLHSVADAKNAGVRFFPLGSATEYRVECSSCHDPHVNYNADPAYDPFLITSNQQSALCLACHDK